MYNNLSIIVSAKEEGENLKNILPKLKKKTEDVLVVDGHSKDDTKKICITNNVKFLLDNGLGKGDAQRIGAFNAKNDILIFYDADGSHDPKDIDILFEKVDNYDSDLVVCSRKKGGSLDLTANITFIGFIRSTGCDFLTLLFNKMFKTKFSDILYSLKSIRRSKFIELKTTENGFGIEIDILIKSVKKGLKIDEIPSREYARVHGSSKLNTFFGIYFIYQILREKFFTKQ